MSDVNDFDYQDGYNGTITPIFRFAVRNDLIDCGINFFPSKAHKNDTGWDVKAAETVILRAGQYAKIPLGFRTLAPKGYWLEIRPRSSSFAKKQLHALYGVLDEGWEGENIFACQYIPDLSAMGKDLTIKFGDAVGQIIPIKRQEMIVQNISNEEFARLSEERKSVRGTGGFGSSDRK